MLPASPLQLVTPDEEKEILADPPTTIIFGEKSSTVTEIVELIHALPFQLFPALAPVPQQSRELVSKTFKLSLLVTAVRPQEREKVLRPVLALFGTVIDHNPEVLGNGAPGDANSVGVIRGSQF